MILAGREFPNLGAPQWMNGVPVYMTNMQESLTRVQYSIVQK